MRWLRRRSLLVDYVGAMVNPGDHGIKPDPTDKRRVGLLELTENLRWVPESGEGWSFPISEVSILSPPTTNGRRLDRVDLSLPGLGSVRVHATISVGIYPITTSREIGTSVRETDRLRGNLLRRGAIDASAPGGTGSIEDS